jgi:acetyl-CoA carboxylase carboxyl transferase subunit alpha
VISPEGCAAILWKDSSKVEEAAQALCLTAKDLLRLGIIDQIIEEPLGGAHTDPDATSHAIKESLLNHLLILKKERKSRLLEKRREKFKKIGIFKES